MLEIWHSRTFQPTGIHPILILSIGRCVGGPSLADVVDLGSAATAYPTPSSEIYEGGRFAVAGLGSSSGTRPPCRSAGWILRCQCSIFGSSFLRLRVSPYNIAPLLREIHTTLSLHNPYAGGGHSIFASSPNTASSSLARITGIGVSGAAKPPGPTVLGILRIRLADDELGGCTANMQSLMREWQKKTAIDSMRRISRMWKGWLVRGWPIAMARSRSWSVS